MAGEESPVKRLKLQSDDIFLSFHKSNLQDLKGACYIIEGEQSGYGVGVSKITVCDAQSSKEFSEATCVCKEFRRNENQEAPPEGYNISDIFQYGYDMIEAYIESPEYLPQRKGARLALTKLLTFLSDIDSAERALSYNPAGGKETEWTVRVAHHLLSKLTVGPDYTLDNMYREKRRDLTCSCGCGEKLSGKYGDATLGVPSCWHGRVDILTDVPVRTFAEEKPDSPDGGNSPSVEWKSTKHRMTAGREGIRAETIVFSFLQRKVHPELENFLIPTVAVSRSHVAICLYDSENDMMLETPLLDLFQGKYLVKATVITLWLALNFKYCCSGVPEEIMNTGFKADFFNSVGPVLGKYRNDVSFPCDFFADKEWLVLPRVWKLKKKLNNVNQIYRPQK